MEVNVVKRIVTKDWDRYCTVVLNSNGRIKPDWVVIDGNQEKHPEGSYYIEWREDGQRKRLSVGNDATVAFNSRIRKLKELEARAQGLEVQVPKDEPRGAGVRLRQTNHQRACAIESRNRHEIGPTRDAGTDQ